MIAPSRCSRSSRVAPLALAALLALPAPALAQTRAAAQAPSTAATATTPGTAPAPAPLRAVFHFFDPSRDTSVRGLQAAAAGLRTLGAEPAHFVFLVQGPAMRWFRRAERDNLAEPLGALIATGRVEVHYCRITLEQNHWREADMLPGGTLVPSGTVDVLRLQQQGYAYFRP